MWKLVSKNGKGWGARFEKGFLGRLSRSIPKNQSRTE